MDTRYYLHQFEKIAASVSEDVIPKENIKVGVWIDSVVIKVQALEWLGNPPLRAFEQSVFFSVWISDGIIKQDKLYYNIHALSLRELKGYKIKSRDFASDFREAFKAHENQWPNVSTDFGPQTLMEGFIEYDDNKPEMVAKLIEQFAQVRPIIDILFNKYRKFLI